MASCPHCKAPIAEAGSPARYCTRCFLAFRWEGQTPHPDLPEVKTGAPLVWLDLRRERPPGMKEGDFTVGTTVRVSQHGLGLGVELQAGKAFESAVPFVRRRDHCARATFVAYDASVVFQVVVRRDSVGEASTQYALAVSPGRKAFRVLRVTSGPTKSVATALLDWRPCQRIGGVGELVDCELRALGATLEARVGGEVVARVHEPRLGVGWPGVRIEAEGAPGRAVWASFEVREVAP